MKTKEIEELGEAIGWNGTLKARIRGEKERIETVKGHMADNEKRLPEHREELAKATQAFEELCRDAKKVLPVSLFNKTVPKRRRTT